MKIKQIRNATIRIEYAGTTFLLDPWLAPKGVFCMADIPGRPFHIPDPMKEQIPMPIYGLPESVDDVLKGVDCYVVTHLHPDHIDLSGEGTVGAPLHKETPIFSQNDSEAAVLKRSGFQTVHVLQDAGTEYRGLRMTKTPALHGTFVPCGDACGVIFEAQGEKTLYVAGDTIWYDGVRNTLNRFHPDVIILNACAAELVEHGRLIMNDEDVECVARTAPQARIVISHMDTVAHASITRYSLRGLLARRGVKDYLMPEDGEVLEL